MITPDRIRCGGDVRDYALPVVVAYLADWLGIDAADVIHAVDDQPAAGDMFDSWPPLATPEMDDRYRALMARPDLRGIAAEARDLVRSGALGEREAWGVLYAVSVSAVATATAITLTVGLGVEHGLWHRMTDVGDVRAAVEEAVRLGSPFPQASRFAREPFTLGDVAVEPGEQVLMWLTAANRGLPAGTGSRWTGTTRGATTPSTWAGGRATTCAVACTTPGRSPRRRWPRWRRSVRTCGSAGGGDASSHRRRDGRGAGRAVRIHRDELTSPGRFGWRRSVDGPRFGPFGTRQGFSRRYAL
jgi:hypothetical protein